MMDQRYRNAMPVCQCLQNTNVPIVIGLGVCLIPSGSDTLERVDHHQTGGRMILEKMLHLIDQPIVELFGHHSEVQRRWCILGEIKEPALNTLEAVLQTEIEDFTRASGEVPEGLPLSYLEAQPQRQPGLADLWCSRQQVQTRRQQVLHKKGNRFVVNGLQGIGINGT